MNTIEGNLAEKKTLFLVASVSTILLLNLFGMVRKTAKAPSSTQKIPLVLP